MLTKLESFLNFCFCKLCLYEKIKKTYYKSLAKKGEYPMDYIYTDITGILSETGYKRFCYCVIFSNNNTQLSKAILIVNKSDIFAKFQKFLAKY